MDMLFVFLFFGTFLASSQSVVFFATTEEDTTGSPVFSSWTMTVENQTVFQSCNLECRKECNWVTKLCYGQASPDNAANTMCTCFSTSIIRSSGEFCGPRGIPCSDDHGSELGIRTWIDGQDTLIPGYQGLFPQTETI